MTARASFTRFPGNDGPAVLDFGKLGGRGVPAGPEIAFTEIHRGTGSHFSGAWTTTDPKMEEKP
ncbi:hypothetical protein GCM10023192_49790 [Amycolatopsis samaneae]